MAAAPLFRRGDTVYLVSSTIIGRLDSFIIHNSKQAGNKWIYDIGIGKKPPRRQTAGDKWDKRQPELSLFYSEEALTDFCSAVDLAISAIQTQLNSVTAEQSAICAESTVPDSRGAFDPKYENGDIVYLDASARLGFFQKDIIDDIYEVGIQPGSKKTRYKYTLSGVKGRERVIFREDELITQCEAFPKVISSLSGQLQELINHRDSKCPSI